MEPSLLLLTLLILGRQRAVSQLDSDELLDALDYALVNERIVPFFQPIAQAHNRRFLGYEVLARWPVGGQWISAAEFIPALRRRGWLGRLDWLMLRHACAALEHFDCQWLSVNISETTLLAPCFSERLRGLMASYFVNPARLNLEISETIAIGVDPLLSHGLLPALQAISATDLGVFVDDYGSAYAQLNALLSICQAAPSVRAIKIDAYLISGVDKVPLKQILCRNVIELAHALGLTAIAEGVETEAEALTLHSLRCDYLQGYLLGKPLPLEDYLG